MIESPEILFGATWIQKLFLNLSFNGLLRFQLMILCKP